MKPSASSEPVSGRAGPALLVAQTSFLGDVVLTTPLLAELRTSLRPRRLAVLVRPEAAPLLAGHPAVDDVLIDDKRGRDHGLRGGCRGARRRRRALRAPREQRRCPARRSDPGSQRWPGARARRLHRCRDPGSRHRSALAPDRQRQRADACRLRARHSRGGGFLRDDAGTRLRAVGRRAHGDRRRTRLPAVRAARRAALSARHRGLHAPRRTRGGARCRPPCARRARPRMNAGGDVGAVVLGLRGGGRLARALGSVAWAAERIVVDAAGRIDAATLPPGVRRVASPLALVGATRAVWLLLLHEDEVASPDLAAAVRAATASGVAAHRIGRTVAFGAGPLAPPGGTIRPVRRDAARLHGGPGGSFALAGAGVRAPRLPARLVVEASDSLEDAVETLDADATALAALLHALGVRPRLDRLALAPVVAAVPLLVARGGPLGWGRWVAAVLVGYRAFVVQAKLWERGVEACA